MNPYFEQMILSASPIELVRLLYQRAIAAVRDARADLKDRQIAERCASINVAYSVLLELTGSLREDGSPELVARLKGLYGYMQGRLIDANLNQTDEPLAEVLGLLTTLAEAWNSIPEDADVSPAEPDSWDAGVAPAGDPVVRYAVSV
jgi:flagellar secretion chaperone FliS